MTQPYSPELHSQVGTIMGIPVFENADTDEPRLIQVPIPGTSDYRMKLIVRDWCEFEREWWIETTLNRVISEQMGDTLQWLYGKRTWTSPSCSYSQLRMRVQLQKQIDTTKLVMREFGRRLVDSVRTLRSASAAAAGLSVGLDPSQDSGFTVTRPVDDLNT